MTRNSMPRTFIRLLAGTMVSCVAVVAIGGCSLGPNDLPSVRAGVSNDYQVTVRFAGVMNLPAGADVIMNGLRVGEVQSLRSADDGIDVTIGLSAQTKVPADVRAIIRQNTLLGDTYIALTPEPSGSAQAAVDFLHPNSVVPIERTTSPPQLEDTIAVMAYFVNGGSIQKMQDTMATLNTAMPALPDVRSLAATVSVDLADLAARTDEIDRFLDGTNSMAVAIDAKSDELRGIFSPAGADYWKQVATAVVAHISTLLPSVGSIFEGGLWLVPMLNSLADTAESGRGMWDRGPEASTRLTNFLRTTVLPFAEHPAVNVSSVTAGDGSQLLGDTESILRMLGAIR